MTNAGAKILAAGSWHGDDRAGWKIVGRLRPDLPPGVEALALADPLELLEHLEGCTHLVLVDACRTGAQPGTIIRLSWPDSELNSAAGSSTHGFGVAAALALAAALGRLPAKVVLLGLEVQDCGPGLALSGPVRAALPKLCQQVLREVQHQEGALP
jgi:hydrogenase maturation protease